MAKPGSEAAHEARVSALIGDSASQVLSSPVAYPPASRPDLIRAALVAGKICRFEVADARVLLFSNDNDVAAVVTERALSGYRRQYRRFDHSDLDGLLALLEATYAK